jgi:hypothetical protein
VNGAEVILYLREVVEEEDMVEEAVDEGGAGRLKSWMDARFVPGVGTTESTGHFDHWEHRVGVDELLHTFDFGTMKIRPDGLSYLHIDLTSQMAWVVPQMMPTVVQLQGLIVWSVRGMSMLTQDCGPFSHIADPG